MRCTFPVPPRDPYFARSNGEKPGNAPLAEMAIFHSIFKGPCHLAPRFRSRLCHFEPSNRLRRKPLLIGSRDVVLDHFPAAVSGDRRDLLRCASGFGESNGGILAQPVRGVLLGPHASQRPPDDVGKTIAGEALSHDEVRVSRRGVERSLKAGMAWNPQKSAGLLLPYADTLAVPSMIFGLGRRSDSTSSRNLVRDISKYAVVGKLIKISVFRVLN